MSFQYERMLKLSLKLMWFIVSWFNHAKTEEVLTEDYCMLESFQTRCLKNEVVLMKSATYGRMRVGRCVTAEEVEAHRLVVGEDPRYLGCYADVLPILDHKCSGKSKCEVKWSDISAENIKPCFLGLTVYLEVSYSCISIADGVRSCIVLASKFPTHILHTDSVDYKSPCGTESQPWVIEAPAGQKINISVLDFTIARSQRPGGSRKKMCWSHGTIIIEKTGKRNLSICEDGVRRETTIYISTGNTVAIILNNSRQRENKHENVAMIVKVEAVGCSDIIPAEDTWLKRNDDNTILVGCFSSRHTWRLSCKNGSWVGVLGNCSKDDWKDESHAMSNIDSSGFSDGQILTVVAIGGFTVIICLAIICSGAVCLRRFYSKMKKKQEFRTLDWSANSARKQVIEQQILMRFQPDQGQSDTNRPNMFLQQMPTYSVYAGESNLSNIDHPVSLSTED